MAIPRKNKPNQTQPVVSLLALSCVEVVESIPKPGSTNYEKIQLAELLSNYEKDR